MRDEREKTMMFHGRSMNFSSTGSQLSSRENMRLVPPNDGSDGQFPAEAARKRKAMDSDLVSNVYNGVSPRFWANLSGNFRRELPRESSLQHNLITPDSHWKTPEMFSNHNSQSSKPTNAQSQCGNYQFYNLNNSLMSLQRRDENFHEAAVDSLKSYTFHQKEPSFLVKTPLGGIPKLPDSQNHAYDIASHSEDSKFQSYYKQSGDYMEKTQAALRSNNGLNSGLGNNIPPSTQYFPCTMSSQNLTYLESSQLRLVNEEFNRGGGTCVQDFSKSGLVELKKSGQNMGFVEDNKISVCTTNTGQTSVHDEKETCGSYRYSSTEIRSSNFPCNDNLDAHLNVRYRDMLQLPALGESSSREEACLDYGMPKNVGHFSTYLETKLLETEDRLNNENKCHSLGEGTSPESHSTLAIRPVDLCDAPSSLDLDEQNKSVAAKISPIIVEKLWDGSLQLNTSTTVLAVAFFKSGEKAQDINWSEHIEIKGKVRLQAFEKFIQELPRSRHRALMVISLCWKVGSSKAGLMGMKEVAKGYRQSERVGFAQICPGIDLYVCPRSDTIITILAKYGFFKGMAAVEEDQDSLIGCVVWRRSHPSSNPIPQKSERKKVLLPEQPVNSPESSIVETNSPVTKLHDPESKQATSFRREPDGVPSQLISDARPTDLDNARHKMAESEVIKSNSNLYDASSYQTNCGQETAPALYSSLIPVELPAAQKSELTSMQETVEHAEMQSAEPRNPDLGSEPMQPVLSRPPPMLPEIQQRNTRSCKDFNDHSGFHTSPIPELGPSIPFNSPLRQVQPSRTQWPDSCPGQDPTESVLRAGIPTIHTAELRKLDVGFELTGFVVPGPPQLPPEVLQRIIQSSRDAPQDPMKGMPKAGIPMMHIAESKKTVMGCEPTGPTLPQAPQSLPQTQQNPADPDDDDDDLPEFDFSSACGVPEAPVSKFPWSSHRSHLPEAPQFSKQQPIEVVKNAGGPTPPAVPMLKSTEVMQRSQASSFPVKSFNTYQGTTLPTKFGELSSERKPEYPASQSLSRPCTVESDKGSVNLKSSSSFPQKSRWDDDDDMPEWCPPDLEHLDVPQPSSTTRLPSPILKLPSESTEPRPPILAQSQTSFHQPRSQDILHGYQPGLLGPRPAGGNPSASMQTRPVAGFVQSEIRPPAVPDPNHSSRRRMSQFDIKPPSDDNWRWRRP